MTNWTGVKFKSNIYTNLSTGQMASTYCEQEQEMKIWIPAQSERITKTQCEDHFTLNFSDVFWYILSFSSCFR